MSIGDILKNDREELPLWLLQEPELDRETLTKFFSSRIVYYPGAGTDGRAIAIFNETHSAHCFVHIDLSSSAQQVKQELASDHPRHCNGYAPVVQTEIAPDSLQEMLNLDMQHLIAGQTPRLQPALWTILKRNSDRSPEHGSEYLAFLHIQAEAVWACWNFWGRHDQNPYAVILQDHGFGGNHAPFGGADAPLYSVAQQTKFLEYLLVTKGTNEWPSYHTFSEWTHRVDGNQNKLYRRIE